MSLRLHWRSWVLALVLATLVVAGCGTPSASNRPGPIQTPAGATPRGEPVTSPMTSP